MLESKELQKQAIEIVGEHKNQLYVNGVSPSTPLALYASSLLQEQTPIVPLEEGQ